METAIYGLGLGPPVFALQVNLLSREAILGLTVLGLRA